ncbi:Zinc finger BED domain-containing protein RICESLEEPER 2 [Glycine max]|nr:Zinc finger BED domain-containing protein RICESLEEPER 2 [Glycine max]
MIKRKYEKYWGDIDKVNNFLYFGVMFDPDFKHEILMWSFVTLFKYNNIFTEKLCTSIRKNCKKAYKEQTKSEQSSHGLGNFASAAKTSVCAETSSYLARTNAFKRHLAEKDSIDIQNEFERYLAEKCVDVDDSFDVLVWWKQNASRFPTLSRMVKDILATPISIVASESDFSIGGRVIDCFRSSLNPQMEEALIFAQNWLRPILAQLKGLKIIEDIEISEAQ